jgi:hypothetical protein
MHASLHLPLFQGALNKTHDAEQFLVHQRLAHELDVRRQALDSLGVVCVPLLGSWFFGEEGEEEEEDSDRARSERATYRQARRQRRS